LDKGGFETRDKREGMTEVAFFHRDIVTFAGGTSACGTLDGEGGSGQSHKDTNDIELEFTHDRPSGSQVGRGKDRSRR
jgi:hypothetical protein